jgi:hypothetical protein
MKCGNTITFCILNSDYSFFTAWAYRHVVVVCRGRMIDYKSKYTYPLTNERLKPVCGENTSFQKNVSGYRIFPSLGIFTNLNNSDIKIGDNNIIKSTR